MGNNLGNDSFPTDPKEGSNGIIQANLSGVREFLI